MQLARLRKVGILFAVTSLANVGWVFAWHYDQILLSTLLIASILVLLAVIAVTLRDHPLTSRELWLVRVPFSVYFGWITVATIANMTALLVSLGFDGFGISEVVWAVVIILVGLLIAGATILINKDSLIYQYR